MADLIQRKTAVPSSARGYCGTNKHVHIRAGGGPHVFANYDENAQTAETAVIETCGGGIDLGGGHLINCGNCEGSATLIEPFVVDMLRYTEGGPPNNYFFIAQSFADAPSVGYTDTAQQWAPWSSVLNLNSLDWPWDRVQVFTDVEAIPMTVANPGPPGPPPEGTNDTWMQIQRYSGAGAANPGDNRKMTIYAPGIYEFTLTANAQFTGTQIATMVWTIYLDRNQTGNIATQEPVTFIECRNNEQRWSGPAWNGHNSVHSAHIVAQLYEADLPCDILIRLHANKATGGPPVPTDLVYVNTQGLEFITHYIATPEVGFGSGNVLNPLPTPPP